MKVRLLPVIVMVAWMSPLAAQAQAIQAQLGASSPGAYEGLVRYEKRFRGDLRIGGAWPNEEGASAASIGGSLAWYPLNGPVTRRLGVYVSSDYRQLSRSVSLEPCLESSLDFCYPWADGAAREAKSRTTQHWIATSVGVSVDLVRKRRFSLEARRGGAAVRESTSFDVWRAAEIRRRSTAEMVALVALTAGRYWPEREDVEREAGFANQCDVDAFRYRCSSQRTGMGQWGLAARFWDKTSTVSLGIDYTKLGVGHQLVGTLSARFPASHPPRPRNDGGNR